MWVQTQPNAQFCFQKLNVDNIRYFVSEVLPNFIASLFFLLNILSRIVDFFFLSDSFVSNCTQFYKMIKQLHYWQIFGNSADEQLIAFLSINKKIIACTNLKMNEFRRKLYLKYRNINNMTQLLCLKLYRLRLFIQANVLLFLLFPFF